MPTIDFVLMYMVIVECSFYYWMICSSCSVLALARSGSLIIDSLHVISLRPRPQLRVTLQCLRVSGCKYSQIQRTSHAFAGKET